MSNDTRKTRHWPSMHQPVDDTYPEPETRVPCPVAGAPCEVCGALMPGPHADVSASQRRGWRERHGFPASSVPADRHERKEKP